MMHRLVSSHALTLCLAALCLPAAIAASPNSSKEWRPSPIHGAVNSISSGSTGQPIQCLDARTGSLYEYRAQHVFSSGAVDDSWSPDSFQHCIGSSGGAWNHLVSDGLGGVYAAWVDSRVGDPDIYVQHFGANGDTASGWPAGGKA